MISALQLSVFPVYGQSETPNWQEQVRKFAQEQNWAAAMRLVDEQIARAPNDMEVQAWRARVLTWSGHLAEAEQEYLHILGKLRTDPDIWLGLSNVYLREGKIQAAQQAIDTAEELDPSRADLHAARAQVLRAAGKPNEARAEFRKALELDPANAAGRAGLAALRGEPKEELLFAQENDFFNFADPIHDEYADLESRWTPGWSTSVVGQFYQRYAVEAGKFLGSVTRRQPRWGAFTLGGAIGHDNGVIPKSEAFFALDHGWRLSETKFLRGAEFAYEQHWYWYQTARILTLNGAVIFYLPREWTFSLGATGARSAFPGTGPGWRPSGSGRLEFPIARWGEKRLLGNVLFAAGTEDFAQVDQIGRFSSQTYGGGVRFRLSARQEVSEYVTYQKRTQDRTDLGFGLSYGIHF